MTVIKMAEMNLINARQRLNLLRAKMHTAKSNDVLDNISYMLQEANEKLIYWDAFLSGAKAQMNELETKLKTDSKEEV